jgi:hypothetical protein
MNTKSIALVAALVLTAGIVFAEFALNKKSQR